MTDTLQDLRSRLSDPTELFPEAAELSNVMRKAVYNGAIPRTTVHLVQLRAGQLVGNTYQVVQQTNHLLKAGQSTERVAAVASWPDAPYFTDAERVALELVESCLLPRHSAERVGDELFDRAAAHYDDRQLWTLILAISQINFFIPFALVAKPIPGRPYGKNYQR